MQGVYSVEDVRAAEQALMAALRWRWILRQLGYPLTAGASLEAWLVGQCASQVLPAVVGGDAARVVRMRRYAVPTTAAIVSVFIDRFAGFVALVALSAFTVPLLTTYEIKIIPSEIFCLSSSTRSPESRTKRRSPCTTRCTTSG